MGNSSPNPSISYRTKDGLQINYVFWDMKGKERFPQQPGDTQIDFMLSRCLDEIDAQPDQIKNITEFKPKYKYRFTVLHKRKVAEAKKERQLENFRRSSLELHQLESLKMTEQKSKISELEELMKDIELNQTVIKVALMKIDRYISERQASAQFIEIKGFERLLQLLEKAIKINLAGTKTNFSNQIQLLKFFRVFSDRYPKQFYNYIPEIRNYGSIIIKAYHPVNTHVTAYCLSLLTDYLWRVEEGDNIIKILESYRLQNDYESFLSLFAQTIDQTDNILMVFYNMKFVNELIASVVEDDQKQTLKQNLTFVKYGYILDGIKAKMEQNYFNLDNTTFISMHQKIFKYATKDNKTDRRLVEDNRVSFRNTMNLNTLHQHILLKLLQNDNQPQEEQNEDNTEDVIIVYLAESDRKKFNKFMLDALTQLQKYIKLQFELQNSGKNGQFADETQQMVESKIYLQNVENYFTRIKQSCTKNNCTEIMTNSFKNLQYFQKLQWKHLERFILEELGLEKRVMDEVEELKKNLQEKQTMVKRILKENIDLRNQLAELRMKEGQSSERSMGKINMESTERLNQTLDEMNFTKKGVLNLPTPPNVSVRTKKVELPQLPASLNKFLPAQGSLPLPPVSNRQKQEGMKPMRDRPKLNIQSKSVVLQILATKNANSSTQLNNNGLGSMLPPPSLGSLSPPPTLGSLPHPPTLGSTLPPPPTLGSTLPPPPTLGSLPPPPTMGSLPQLPTLGNLSPPQNLGSTLSPPPTLGSTLPPPPTLGSLPPPPTLGSTLSSPPTLGLLPPPPTFGSTLPPPPTLGSLPPPPTLGSTIQSPPALGSIPSLPTLPGLPGLPTGQVSNLSMPGIGLMGQTVQKLKDKRKPPVPLKACNYTIIQYDKIVGTIFEEIDDTKIQFNETQIVELFQKVAPIGNKKQQSSEDIKTKSSQPPKQNREVVKLLGSDRWRNFEIILTKLKMQPGEITKTLTQCTGKFTSSANLESILKLTPNEEQEQMVKTYEGNMEDLGKPERFLKQLMEVPEYHSRIKAMIFSTIKEQFFYELSSKIEQLTAGFESLKENKRLKKVLMVCLGLGNYLNGTTMKGGAWGFKLQTIERLEEVKSNDNKMNAAFYLIKQVWKEYPYPIFEKDEIELYQYLSKMPITQVNQELGQLNLYSKAIERAIKSHSKNNSNDSIGPFCEEIMMEVAVKVQQYKSGAQKINQMYLECAKYYCEDGKKLVSDQFGKKMFQCILFVSNTEKMFKIIEDKRLKEQGRKAVKNEVVYSELPNPESNKKAEKGVIQQKPQPKRPNPVKLPQPPKANILPQPPLPPKVINKEQELKHIEKMQQQREKKALQEIMQRRTSKLQAYRMSKISMVNNTKKGSVEEIDFLKGVK